MDPDGSVHSLPESLYRKSLDAKKHHKTGDLTPQEAAEFLRSRDNFLIVTHVRPDGDTLGCGAALCRALRGLEKTAVVLPNDRTSAGYAPYMVGLWAGEGYEPDTVVTVDLASESMFTDNAERYRGHVDLAIDHHINGGQFALRRCVEASRGACGEIVYEIVSELCPLTPEIALALYVALSTDTGCFSLANTTGETHRIASELIAVGIDYRAANKRHFCTKSKRRIAMEGELFSGLDFFDGDRGVFLTITRAMIERLHLDEDDLDNVAALGSQIEGVDCAITLREQEDGGWKASVRTTERINAAVLCAMFGGGGHAEAAGCILHGMTLSEVKSALTDAVKEGGRGTPRGHHHARADVGAGYDRPGNRGQSFNNNSTPLQKVQLFYSMI